MKFRTGDRSRDNGNAKYKYNQHFLPYEIGDDISKLLSVKVFVVLKQ